jgi:biopolymer transport protein ExbD
MKIQSESAPYDSINVTPMLDLAYVLLVVFILMTTAGVQGLTVSMPKPSKQPPAERRELVIVQVMSDGTVLINGAAVDLAALESQLRAAQARDPRVSVAIKGDARAPYAGVVAVIDLCNRVGVDMGLVTARIGT